VKSRDTTSESMPRGDDSRARTGGCQGAQWGPQGRGMAMLVYLGAFLFLFALCAPGCIAQPASTAEMDCAHCGKKFRIATHVAPPFINVDVDKCVEQKCPREALGDNGGVVYKLMMKHILPCSRSAPDLLQGSPPGPCNAAVWPPARLLRLT